MDLVEKFCLDDIDDVAILLLKNVETKTILFFGEMGVGKTTLISALVKALGGLTKVSSPTFSIVNEYEIKDDIVYHFDFYRIEKIEEILDIGIEDYFSSKHWKFIEWPDKIDVFLPNDAQILDLKRNNDGSRTLKLSDYNKKSKIN